MKNKLKRNRKVEEIASALTGKLMSEGRSQATDSMIDNMKLFDRAVKRLTNVAPKIKQGNLFEYIEAAKFNYDAVSKESGVEAVVNSANNKPTDAVDINLILRRKDRTLILKKIQAKSSNNPKWIIKEFRKSKYKWMSKLTPKDKIETVKYLAKKGVRKFRNVPETSRSYRNIYKNVKGEIEFNNIRSRGTRFRENIFAAKNPKLYSNYMQLKALSKEVGISASKSAATGFLLSSSVSLIKNYNLFIKGQLTKGELIKESISDGAKTAGKATVVAGGSSVIRFAGKKLKVSFLTKSNIATNVAMGIIDTGVAVVKYAKGEIKVNELFEKLGAIGVDTVSGMYYGAVIGVALGPVGALVGGIGGYILSSYVYAACLSAIKEAKLAENESKRIIALNKEACIQLVALREEIDSKAKKINKDLTVSFENFFKGFDECFGTNDYIGLNSHITNLSLFLGKDLLFKTFDEFDNFMLDPKKKLIL